MTAPRTPGRAWRVFKVIAWGLVILVAAVVVVILLWFGTCMLVAG
jgi:hypothetical protein